MGVINMPEPEATAPETGSDPKPSAKPETDLHAEVEKWKALSRKNEEQAKANADAAKRLAELEESQKTDQQKLADTNKALEERAQKAEADLLRFKVCTSKGIPLSAAPRLRGTTEEELEADADDFLESFKVGTDPQPATPSSGRPKEKLRPGAVPDAEPDPDPEKVLAAIPRI
jgi:hypothetical protein